MKQRKPERYLASKPNREEWPARFVSGDEQILVGETGSFYLYIL